VRVIAGRLGGRQFNSPKGHKTHPMSDKGRGALFNVLGDITGLSVLDAFAGSGALSFEALSRGAATVTAIDNDQSAYTSIVRNSQELGLGKELKTIRVHAGTWSNDNPEHVFDVIIIDPPYDKIQEELLSRLALHAKTGGIVTCSLPPTYTAHLDANFELLKTKDFGDARLEFYRRIS